MLLRYGPLKQLRHGRGIVLAACPREFARKLSHQPDISGGAIYTERRPGAENDHRPLRGNRGVRIDDVFDRQRGGIAHEGRQCGRDRRVREVEPEFGVTGVAHRRQALVGADLRHQSAAKQIRVGESMRRNSGRDKRQAADKDAIGAHESLPPM